MTVLLLESPFNFDDYVRPACLPPINWTSYTYFKGGIMVASGMGRIDNVHLTTELKLASIQMLTKDECRGHPWVKYYFKGKKGYLKPYLNMISFRWYDLWRSYYRHMQR